MSSNAISVVVTRTVAGRSSKSEIAGNCSCDVARDDTPMTRSELRRKHEKPRYLVPTVDGRDLRALIGQAGDGENDGHYGARSII